MRRTGVVVFAVTAFAFIGSPVWADLVHDHVPDQQQEEWSASLTVGTPEDATMMAQTFTPSSDGILCHIQIGNESGVTYGTVCAPTIQIRNTVDDGYGSFKPGETIYESVTLGYTIPYFDNSTKQWVSTNTDEVGWTPLIDFSVPVSQGTMYSIVLSSSIESGTVSVSATSKYGTAYPDYLGGDLWTYVEDQDDNLFWFNDTDFFDMQFRTYLQVVPLPAGVWLGICAVSVAGLHLKRQSV